MKSSKVKSYTAIASLFSLLFLLTIVFLALPAQAAKQGGTVKFAMSVNPDKIDPANSKAGSDMMMFAHIFEGLVNFKYNGKEKKTIALPVLAEKWEKSSDGRTWTFFLRKGVKFHDGTPFNADSVKYNIERTLKDDPRTRYRELKGIVEKVEVIDDFTVKLQCSNVVEHFLYLLGQSTMLMVSPASVEKFGDKVGMNPVGTGPFKFVKWAPGEFIELEKNNEYWGQKANLDGIIFRFVIDNSARINMLLAGEVDVAHNIPVQDHERLNRNKNIEVMSWPTGTIIRLFVNCQKPPTNDVRVRKAVKLATDREGMIEAILRGNATLATSGVAPYSWGHFDAGEITYDPKAAEKLLEEAGWIDANKDGIREKEGKNLSILIEAAQPGRYPMDGEFLLAIQENLRNVGIECKINFMEFAAFMNAVFLPPDKRESAIDLVAYSSRTHAFFSTYPLLHSRNMPPNGLNFVYYKNPEMDALLDQALVESDSNKSIELYKKIQILAEEDVPIINMWMMHETISKRTNIHDLELNPIPVHDTVNMRSAWME